MEIIILDGTKMTSIELAHSYIAKTMRLPSYYGKNLDALDDCLSELGGGVTVILMNSAEMEAALGQYGQRLLEVFDDSSKAPGAFTFILK